MILAGTLTGVQGDIRCYMQSFGGPSKKNNLSWDWPNGRLSQKEVCSYHLFIEMKCTLMRFPTYVTGSSLAEIVKIENTRISN